MGVTLNSVSHSVITKKTSNKRLGISICLLVTTRFN